MVCLHIGKPFALHHISQALHMSVVPDGFLKAYAKSLCACEILKMVSLHIGKPFALHHISQALHRRVITDGCLKAYAYSLGGGEVLKRVQLHVQYYGDPIIFVVGMLGNLLIYLIFTRSRFRKVPSVPYLSGIAVADSGFLSTYFLNTLTYVYGFPIMSQMGVCQFGMFANYVFLFLSMWYSVAVMVERFISVYWPLKKVSLCTVFRAKVVLISLAVLAIVSYSYVIYFFGPDTRFGVCNPWQEFQDPYQILMVLDCIVVFVAPLLVLIALTLLIIIRRCEYYRISSASDFGPGVNSTTRDKSPTQNVLQATEVMFALVGLVLVTHFPNSVVRVLGFFTTQMKIEKTLLVKISSVVRQIHLASFAVKIFVYLMVSGRVRKHTKNLLCCGKDRMVALCNCGNSRELDPQRINLRVCGQAQPAANEGLIQSDV